MTPYSVVIVGAGQIGARYDGPASPHVLTHAHAFSESEQFRLLGFVDSDEAVAQQAARLWKAAAYSTLPEFFTSVSQVDIVCVAVPDAFHQQVLEEVSGYPVRLVFAEKPFTTSSGAAARLVTLYRSQQIPLSVNYTRRFLPAYHQLRSDIRSGLYGRLLGGHAYYGKGALHNGSHLMNLLLFLFTGVRVGGRIAEVSDFHSADPSVSGWLCCEGAVFAILAVDCRAVTIFELELLFEARRVRILASGARLEVQETLPDPVFAGYRGYASPLEVDTGLLLALRYAARNLAEFLEGRAELLSPVEDAVQTLSLCEGLQGR